LSGLFLQLINSIWVAPVYPQSTPAIKLKLAQKKNSEITKATAQTEIITILLGAFGSFAANSFLARKAD
jgi:hypothetical protein